MHIFVHKLIQVTLIAVLTVLPPASLYAKSPAIKILTLDWTSQVVVSHIVGLLLQKTGYSVTYLAETSISQWFLLSSKKANLQVEVWQGSMANDFNRLLDRKLILSAGDHAAQTREEWWFPSYVREKCPGLPDWHALKNCSEIFSGSGGSKGKYYTGPWEKPDHARVRALGLPFEVVLLKDSNALRNKLETAIQAKKPVLIFNWTPNWIESVYEGEFVEFPAYQLACETQNSWGINKQLNWDCGNPKNGWLKKAVSTNFPTTWPCAMTLLKYISFSNKQIANAAALVEVNGLDYEEAAQQWLSVNSSTWKKWLADSNCTSLDDKKLSE
ncbi:MAG: ABC transporter substrate-binding protein [Gammaproteobacteria bacterium]|nr:ABC transporter substrate-binding protein [Gammaproteobacteria bacterium]